MASILHELQERAKELNCLYRVDELLNRPDLPLGADLPRHCGDTSAMAGSIRTIVRPASCLKTDVIESARLQPTEWVQSADIVVQGED